MRKNKITFQYQNRIGHEGKKKVGSTPRTRGEGANSGEEEEKVEKGIVRPYRSLRKSPDDHSLIHRHLRVIPAFRLFYTRIWLFLVALFLSLGRNIFVLTLRRRSWRETSRLSCVWYWVRFSISRYWIPSLNPFLFLLDLLSEGNNISISYSTKEMEIVVAS